MKGSKPKLFTVCQRCYDKYELALADNNYSKHSNAIVFADVASNGNFYTRKVAMLCPRCTQRIKKFLNFEDDLNISDD